MRLSLLAILVLVAAPSVALSPPVSPWAIPEEEIERVEETTESLVNALNDAARGGKASGLAPLLAAEVVLRLPLSPGARARPSRLVDEQAWDLSAPAPSLGHDAAVAAFAKLLGQYSSVEDMRFDVTRSEAPGDAVDGSFRFALVGRARDGKREWLRGSGKLSARHAGGAWLVHRLTFDDATSVVATRELFTEVSASAGVARVDPSLMARGGTGLVSHGAAVADVDNDGLLDVFAPGLASNALFRAKGDGTFEDVAPAAHVAASLVPGVGPLFLDFDSDGDADLFVSAVGKQSLFENRLVPDGKLVFRDVSSRAHVDVEAPAFSATAGDVNGDGLTDVYVACYNYYGKIIPESWDAAKNGSPNLLFLNQGDGTFREAAKELGVDDSRWSYSAQLADADDDGDLDLAVTNDFGAPMGFFLNEVKQTGRFRDVAAERGLGGPFYGMGVSYGDIDLDGDLDLHVTGMSSIAGSRVLSRFGDDDVPGKATLRILAAGNALFRNAGGARFENVSATAGPFLAGWAWGGGFFDVDNDGRPDLFTPNGFLSGTTRHDTGSLFWRDVVGSKIEHRPPALAFYTRQAALFNEGYSFSGHERDLFMLNRGDGTFLDLSGVSGLDSVTDGRAAVFADFDDDGDTDVFLRAMHSRAHLLFRNEIGAETPSFRVSLQGTKSGRDAFGAVVRAKVSAGTLTQVKDGGSGFLSQSDPRLLFGLGKDSRAEWLEVSWPSGLKQRFEGPKAHDSWLIVEGEAKPRVIQEKRFNLKGAAR